SGDNHQTLAPSPREERVGRGSGERGIRIKTNLLSLALSSSAGEEGKGELRPTGDCIEMGSDAGQANKTKSRPRPLAERTPPSQPVTSPRKRIIILGGGFAGVKCAQTLSRALSRDEAEIVLFNAENHLVFTPLLADVIGASVNPLDVV